MTKMARCSESDAIACAIAEEGKTSSDWSPVADKPIARRSVSKAFNLVECLSPAKGIGHLTTLYHRQQAQSAMLGYPQNRSRGRGGVQRLTASLLHTRGRPAVFLDTATKVASMRAAYYTEQGAAQDVLRVGEQPTPEPGPGEVRVRLRTSGVSRAG